MEAAIIGSFANTGRLRLEYMGHAVGEMDMQFLHHGRPAPYDRPLGEPGLA